VIFAATIPAHALSTAHRAEQFVQHGRHYGRRDPRYTAWLAVIRAAVKRPADWPLEARYTVRIAVFPPDEIRRDADNIAKGILDALQAPRRGGRRGRPLPSTLWLDDSQVRVLEVAIGAADRERPRVCVLALGADDGRADEIGTLAIMHAARMARK
jgi:Holliday junction resolvase RusA-like endonuclease